MFYRTVLQFLFYKLSKKCPRILYNFESNKDEYIEQNRKLNRVKEFMLFKDKSIIENSETNCEDDEEVIEN